MKRRILSFILAAVVCLPLFIFSGSAKTLLWSKAASYAEDAPMLFYSDETADSAWIGIYPEGKPYDAYNYSAWIWCRDLKNGYAYLSDFVAEEQLPLSPGSYNAVLFFKGYSKKAELSFSVTAAEEESFLYLQQGTDGSAKGEMTLFYGDEHATYTAYWGGKTGKLKEYAPIFSHTVAAGEKRYTFSFAEAAAIPQKADRVLLYKKTDTGETLIDTVKPEQAALQTTEEPLYRFAVLSELHLQERTSHPYNKQAKAVLKKIENVTEKPLDALFLNGDLTDTGSVKEYKQLRRLLLNLEIPVYSTLGNHDVGSNRTDYRSHLKLFYDYTGMTAPYSAFSNEVGTFILLGTENAEGFDSNIAAITTTQLVWLKKQLAAADPNKPVFLFLHQPLKDTVDGSLSYHVSSDESLRPLLESYPNAVLISGHSHMTMQSNAVVTGSGASYVNNGSVCSTWQNDTELGGSEGIVVEVFSDRILVRSRDLLSDQWLGGYEFIIRR